MSLDAARQPHAGSSRYESASPSPHHSEPDDFRARLNRLSLQSSSSASPLSRSSSMRSRPGGGVADVGLGRRSTILNGSMRSERNGLDLGKRETLLAKRDSPYQPSTSYSRYAESSSPRNTMNGQHGSSSEKRYLGASPEPAYSYRSSAYSSPNDMSPARTPTPTASVKVEGRGSATARRNLGHPDRHSARYGTDDRLSVGSGYRSSRDRSDGSSAGRSVSNSTVRDFGNQDDDTLTYKLESKRRSRAMADELPRASDSAEPSDYVFTRSESRSERSPRPASTRYEVQPPTVEHIQTEAEMPAVEKVDMWMRSGSARQGSGDDPSGRRRSALPTEFRNDMVSTCIPHTELSTCSISTESCAASVTVYAYPFVSYGSIPRPKRVYPGAQVERPRIILYQRVRLWSIRSIGQALSERSFLTS